MSNKILNIGVGKANIEFPNEIFPIENFSCVYGELMTRVLIVESHICFVMATFEVTSIRDYEIAVLQDLISRRTGIHKEFIWICVTHTFSAPHTRSLKALSQSDEEVVHKNKLFCTALEDSLSKALEQAIIHKQAAKIGFGHGYCSVNVNRDIYTAEGWWLGTNDLGVSDKTVPIIRFDDLNNQPLCILYSYDVQSSIMDGALLEDGTKPITGDLTGIASEHIESLYDNQVVALYVVGSAGDQAPIFKAKHNIYDRFKRFSQDDIGKDGFVLVNALGRKLGDQVAAATEKIHTNHFSDDNLITEFEIRCMGQRIPANFREIHPTQDYQYEKDEERNIKIKVIRMGYIVIVGMQPVINSVNAIDIRKMSPFPLTMIVTMVNGGAKYMPDQTSYDRITYESMNSMFMRGSAEKLVESTVTCLEDIYECQWRKEE